MTTPPDAVGYVADRLDALVAAFGLEAEAERVREVFDVVCGRALDFPLAQGPAGRSRLNEDGTPIQFATSVGPGPGALRFVADPGPFHAGVVARIRAGREALRSAATLIGAETELAAVALLIGDLAPEDSPALRADPAGAFWIGAAFAPGAAPRLRVYVNGGWGSPAARAARLRRFAEHFGRTPAWDDLAARLPTALAPLGLALTLTPGRPTRGAIYLRAFGLRLAEYAAVAGAGAERIRHFGELLLGADADCPAPSAVLSFGFGAEPGLPAELEYCTHCLYPDDAAAGAALERLFADAGVDPSPYRALSRGLAPHRHCFIGADGKAATSAYTVYMRPDLTPRR
ncbi:hypothetical protein ACQPZX_23295 [Actinoplanes sp. CA-142083]|uniref:hypothetical protein n=1 Tax=Actinoplanes sp. CA-142083 TaxID=3239903 RepID=UPI003D8B6CDF